MVDSVAPGHAVCLFPFKGAMGPHGVLVTVQELGQEIEDEGLTEAMTEHAGDRSRSYAVLWMDVDNFKALKDALGHAAGDAVLGRSGRAPPQEHPQRRPGCSHRR